MGGGGRGWEDYTDCGPSNKTMKMMEWKEVGKENWWISTENWLSRPPEWLWEGIVSAALTGKAPAMWRGPRSNAKPGMILADTPWSEEAKRAKLGDKQEAKRLGWAPGGRSERLTSAILPRVIQASEFVRKARGWSCTLEVGGDGW